MSDEGIPAVRRHAAVIVSGVIGLVVLVLVARGIGGMIAANRRAEVLRAWAGTLGSFEELLERFPDREANETATQVEGLGAALGIDMAPERVEGRPRPTEPVERAYRAKRLVIGDYVQAWFESAGPSVGPPPAAVVDFLREHARTLDALRQLLTDADPPRWELRLEKPFSSPIPNLRGHVDLQRLLLADALIRENAGDSPGALSALETSWQLNAGLRDDPLLASQTTALSVARMQLGTLRHIERLPSLWQARIREHDYRQSVLTSLRYEGWTFMTIFDPPPDSGEDAPYISVVSRVARPYVSYCAADVSDGWRKLLIQFSELTSVCDADPDEPSISPTLDLPSWNLVGGQWLSGLGDLAQRMARYELDREMTAKLIEIRAARAVPGSPWPVSLPGIESSTACPDDHWSYEVTAGGEMSLALSRRPDWGGLTGATLATRYAVPTTVAGDDR